MSPLEILATLAEVGVAPQDGAIADRISVGIGGALDRIEEETFPFVAAGGGELKFVHAPYGRGKTHFLRALQHRARQRGFVTAYVDCQDYGSPFQSLSDTYRAVASNMIPPRDVPSGRGGAGPVIEGAFDPDRLNADRSLVPDYRNLVRSYRSARLSGDDGLLSQRLESLLNADPVDRVAPGALNRMYPWLPRPLGKLGRRNAGQWLRCVLSLPNALGYPGLVVLFDETETLLNRGGMRKIQERLAHLRTFVDHMAVGAIHGCAVFCATAENFVDDARRYLPALSQRIERSRFPGRDKARNPLAVWVGLDELTDPGPRDRRFFDELARRIVDLGREAGAPDSKLAPVSSLMDRETPRYVDDIQEGKVREFVRTAAGHVVGAIDRRASAGR